MLIDSHCHLDSEKIFNNIDEIKQKAKDAGVTKMLSAGVTIKTFAKLNELANSYDDVFCSVGIHPHYASREEEKNVSVEELIELSHNPKVLGFGECGFDFYYQNSAKKDQEEVFKKHILASQETGLPLIVHTRDADDKTAEVIMNEYHKKPFKGLIHCFTSGYDFAMKMVDIDFYISVSGIITFDSAENIREAVKAVPLDRLLVETDSPYLAPTPYRGKANEPSYVKFVADKLAKIKGVSSDEIAKVTTANFMRLFEKCQ